MATASGRAAGTVLASPAIDIAAVRSTLVAELAAARAERADLTRRAEECDSVAATLAELPGRADRSAMIPLGRAAFLPGRLSNSPSVLVRVGEGPLLVSWFQENSVLCCAVRPVCRQPRSDRVFCWSSAASSLTGRARRRTAGRDNLAGHACSGPRRAGGGLLAEQPAGQARAGVLRRAAALRATAGAAGAAEAALTRRLQVADAAVLGPLQAAAADGLARAPAGRACRVWVRVRQGLGGCATLAPHRRRRSSAPRYTWHSGCLLVR